MTLLRIACLQASAFFLVSLGYLTLSRLLVVQTFVLDFAYLILTTTGLVTVLRAGAGWPQTVALAAGGATGGAVAIMLAILMGLS